MRFIKLFEEFRTTTSEGDEKQDHESQESENVDETDKSETRELNPTAMDDEDFKTGLGIFKKKVIG